MSKKFYEKPNYFGLISKEDTKKRKNKAKKSFKRKGYDDSYFWSYDQTLAKFLNTTLPGFHKSHKKIVEDPELNDVILPKMIEGFKLLKKYDTNPLTQDELNKISEAFTLLGQNYNKLWI